MSWISGWAIRMALLPVRREQDDRSGAQLRESPLFDVEGHSAPARRDRQSLQDELRCRSRSGDRSDRHDRRKGRAGAPAVCGRSDPATRSYRRTPLIRFISTASSWRKVMRACCRCRIPRHFSKAWRICISGARRKPRLILISFPHNPTTQCVDLDFMKEIVELARHHGSMVVHDFAYADLCFDGYKAPSILQVPGAKDVAVEIFSMSKSYNMAGWRVGFCLGNQKMIAALARIKSYLDYGVFQPIQIASIIALRECEEDTKKICNLYQKRRDVLVNGLKNAGWPVEKPKGSMFVWAPHSGAVSEPRIAGILEAAAGEGAGGGIAGHRLRTPGRRPRAICADRKRSAHPPGASLDQAVSEAVKIFFSSLLLLPALAHGAWRTVPANLWAMQAPVPPGTNNTQAVQQVTPAPQGGGQTPPAVQGSQQQVIPVVGAVPVAPNQAVSNQSVFPAASGAPAPSPSNAAPVGIPSQGGPPPPGFRPAAPGGQPLPPGVMPAGQQHPSGATVVPSPAAVPTNAPPAATLHGLPACEVTLRLSRTELPPGGGEFTVSTIRKPANCPASIAVSAPWLTTADPLSCGSRPNRTTQELPATR